MAFFFFKKTKTNTISRNDGFENVLTGLNTSKDKSKAFVFKPPRKISYPELDWYLRYQPLVFKVCNKLVSDATKKPLKFPDLEDKPDEFKFYSDFLTKILNIYENMSIAGTWQQAFGGAVIILDIDDGQDPSMPVNLKNIKGIGKNPLVLDRYSIYAENFKIHSEPDVYYINKPGEGSVYIHESRLLIFKNPNSTNKEKQENNGWSDSSIPKYLDAIQYYTTAVDSCNALMTDICQGVYKVTGLNRGIGNKEYEEKLVRKYTLIDRAKGLIKGILIDSEDDYQRITTNTTGVKDLVQVFKDFLSAVLDMPHNILLNEAPAGGLGSKTGDGEMEAWENTVNHYQNNQLRKHFERVLTYISAIKKEQMPNFEFESIEPTNEVECADIDNKKADTELKLAQAEETRFFIGNSKKPDSNKSLENKKILSALSEKKPNA